MEEARRGRGELVVVHEAGHSWVLRDPQTLPAIAAQLLDGRLGEVAFERAFAEAGLDRASATLDDIEDAFYEPDALVLSLTPAPSPGGDRALRKRARYRFSIDDRWVDVDGTTPVADGRRSRQAVDRRS